MTLVVGAHFKFWLQRTSEMDYLYSWLVAIRRLVAPTSLRGLSWILRVFHYLLHLMKGFARRYTWLKKSQSSGSGDQCDLSPSRPDDMRLIHSPPKTSYVCPSNVPIIIAPTDSSSLPTSGYATKNASGTSLEFRNRHESAEDVRDPAGSSQFLSPYGYATRNSSFISQDSRQPDGNSNSPPHLGLTLPQSPSSLGNMGLGSRSSLRLVASGSDHQPPGGSCLEVSTTTTFPASNIDYLSSARLSRTTLGSVHVASPGGAGPIRIDLKPTTAKKISGARYDRGIVIEKREEDGKDNPKIPALKREFDFDSPVPEGWEACLHPEGALYFYQRNKRILTDANLCDPAEARALFAGIGYLEDALEENHIVMPDDCEIALELNTVDDAKETLVRECGYYFVDGLSRALFWFDTYDVEELLEEVQGKTNLRHLKHELESHYWSHCELFPNHREVPEQLIHEVQGILLHASIDSLTSASSLSPWFTEVTQKMLNMISGTKDIGNENGYSACVIGRLMSVFVHQRFIHYHGLPGARLSRIQTIYGDTKKGDSLLIKLVSPLFFNAPRFHLRTLDDIWVDKVINYQSWDYLMGKLQDEWEHISIIATVMLTVNIGFLAIQSVDRSEDIRSAAQLTSYLSAILSISSIVIGLALSRHHRTLKRDDADIAQYYLWSKYHPELGLEVLAIMYGLPHALLMWSMCAFFVALTCQYFHLNPDIEATSLAGRIPVALTWLIALSLVVWILHCDWQGKDDSLSGKVFCFLKSMWSQVSSGTLTMGQSVGRVLRAPLHSIRTAPADSQDVPNELSEA